VRELRENASIDPCCDVASQSHYAKECNDLLPLTVIAHHSVVQWIE